MKRLAFLALLLTGCAHSRTIPSEPLTGPDMTGVLRITTRFGAGHACPISENLALTSAHIVDLRPFDPAPLIDGFWSVPSGGTGAWISAGVARGRDLALIKGHFPVHFPIAEKAPSEGSYVYVLGYWQDRVANLFADRRFRVKVLREVGKWLVLSENPDDGSSGACVLNHDGQVIGILQASVHVAEYEEAGLAVSVYGEEFALPE